MADTLALAHVLACMYVLDRVRGRVRVPVQMCVRNGCRLVCVYRSFHARRHA